MNCIKILTPSPGGEVPDHIRAAWIGLTLPILLPFEPFSRGQLRGHRLAQFDAMNTFPVDMQLAVEILGLYQREAAQWWRENRKISSRAYFHFHRDCCEIVEGVPSVTATKHLATEINIKEFLQAVSDAEDSVFWLGTIGLQDLFYSKHQAEFEQSALTAPAVLLMAKEVARECTFGIIGASTEDYMNHISESGHRVLSTAHRIAEQSGIKMALELVDQPLSMVEEMERAGYIKVVDGLVHINGQKQLPLELKPS
ncbi:MAG: hypothetical protein Q7R65_00315 [bacterium]|nr:hypothetical protein [bacterium]